MSSKATPFRQGAVDALVFFPILAPFSLLFGVFASDLNLSFFQTLGASLGIFAGASQFASLSLINENAPVFIAILAGFTLNLRFFLYSATLAPHFRHLPLPRRLWLAYLLVDQNFVLSDNQFPQEPKWTNFEKSSYYLGVVSVVAIPWHVFTILGYQTGALIPENINIAFALPLSFIALIVPALKSRPHWIAAILSITITIWLREVPYNLGLLIAGLIAIIVAGQFDAFEARKKKEVNHD